MVCGVVNVLVVVFGVFWNLNLVCISCRIGVIIIDLMSMLMISVICCFYGVVLMSWLVLRFCRLLLEIVVMLKINVVVNMV